MDPQTPPKKKRSPVWYIVVFGVLGVCVCSSFAYSLGNRQATTVDVASQPTPDITRMPAQIVAEEVVVTKAPEPTETTAPSLSDEEQAYVNKAIYWADNYSKAFTAFSRLNSEPKIGNDEWTIQVAASLVSIQLLDKEVSGYEAPAKFAPVHSKFKQGAAHYDKFTNLYMKGMDDFDVDALEEALSEMSQGTELMTDVTAEVQKIRP